MRNLQPTTALFIALALLTACKESEAGKDAGAAGAAASSGAGGAGGAPSFAPTWSAIYSEILIVGKVGNCMFGACHGGPPDKALNGNLQIRVGDPQGAYDHLVNVVSTSDLCAGMTLVVPGDSDASLLIQKFDAAPPCGMPMPIGTPLTTAHIEQIATWIDQGAPNN